jgi:hypothetical protein
MIGRLEEQKELNRLFDSPESEFVALYGRRRVGKTYLVREVFDGRFAFCHTGKSDTGLRGQLAHFRKSLEEWGGVGMATPKNWEEAFDGLKKVVAASREMKKVVFIDEMPWMDTPRSHCLSALESFWNEWASARKDVLLIVCGSAASWMVKNLFRNRGGLHNRVTARIALMPFTLSECEKYAAERGLAMSRDDIAECFMVFGGIPYYWRNLRPGASLAQNIDALLFRPNAPMKGEFGELYKSLFGKSAAHEKVVAALAGKKSGMTRSEISDAVGDGVKGMLTDVLENLECSGFVSRSRMLGKRKRDAVFRLIDNFTLFHFRFLADPPTSPRFWETTVLSPARSAWRGLAFERLCLQHVPQMLAALGVSGVHVEAYAWRHVPDDECPIGAQIDLVLDRADGVVNACEMKYSRDAYMIDAKTEKELSEKLAVFSGVTKTRKAVHLTIVSAHGLLRNSHSGRVQSTIDLDDLFKEAT